MLNTAGRHPSIQHTAYFFDSEHLPAPMKAISIECEGLAKFMLDELPDNPETAVGLRKLLEAKDAFVRARLMQMEGAGAS